MDQPTELGPTAFGSGLPDLDGIAVKDVASIDSPALEAAIRRLQAEGTDPDQQVSAFNSSV